MKFRLTLSILFLSLWAIGAQGAATGKKKVIYKSHTEIDFSGDKIEGKVKSPAVFYIFQRKRSLGHEAARSPARLSFHERSMKTILKEAIRE